MVDWMEAKSPKCLFGLGPNTLGGKEMTKPKSKEPVVEEEETDKTKNPKIKYGDIVEVTVRCKFTKPFMGGVPGGADNPNMLWKGEDGSYEIPGRCLRAMLRDGSKFINRSGTETTQIGTLSVPIEMNGSKVNTITNIPVLSRMGGHGFHSAEIITPGAEFEAVFAVPTKAIPLKTFRKLLVECGKWVGLGAYRKGDFGLFEVLKFNASKEE